MCDWNRGVLLGRSMNGCGGQGIDVHNINIDFPSAYTIAFSCADAPYSNRWMDVHTFPMPYYMFIMPKSLLTVCIYMYKHYTSIN